MNEWNTYRNWTVISNDFWILLDPVHCIVATKYGQKMQFSWDSAMISHHSNCMQELRHRDNVIRLTDHYYCLNIFLDQRNIFVSYFLKSVLIWIFTKKYFQLDDGSPLFCNDNRNVYHIIGVSVTNPGIQQVKWEIFFFFE